MLELYHYSESTCSQKARFVLVEKELEWESQEVDLFKGEQYTPEFLKLNPKGVVPVIVHDGEIVTESNIIIQYLDDLVPGSPLMPPDALGRARARQWMLRLDAGGHMEIAALTFGIALRHQILKFFRSDDELRQFYAIIANPMLLDFYRDIVPSGLESPRFLPALKSYMNLISEIDETISGTGNWLAGNQMTLADAAYLPYAVRLDNLGLRRIWEGKYPHFENWYSRLKETRGYKDGIKAYFSDDILTLMKQKGDEAWPEIERMIAKSS